MVQRALESASAGRQVNLWAVSLCDPAARRIAECFGLRTIAEGVEDAATLERLRGLSADYAQGFHLGRPGPPVT